MATIWPLDMEQQEKKSSGGYPTSIFLAPPPDDLKCTICMEVLRDPLQVCSDQHTYCRTCFASWRSHETCPECRAPFSREEPARIIKNLIDQLDVRCPNACEWTGHLNDCEAHMAACPCLEVSCPFADAGCAFRAARGDMDAHRAHLLMLMTTVAVVEAESVSVRAECAAVRAEIESMREKIASLEEDSSSLQRYMSILHTTGEAEVGVEWVSSFTFPATDQYGEFTYTGQIRAGRCHGFGRASWATVRLATRRLKTYDGQWKEGNWCGRGVFRHSNGDSFDGQWVEDKKHGQGVFRCANG
eukprot:CAMPEP_0173346854 /NCGR_PEP_ID=MMETSP1144-20121109/12797_1 /TAXON_ID=483371 /ORGANISM="non described non described, Strain CCMP2298" /LENGTH=300 /DNA_ID=CAMNT_0014294211 /DNA_START=136 /DNA_END=1034 /DNA_ORIENTATION=-